MINEYLQILIKEELNKMLREAGDGPLGKIAFSPNRIDGVDTREDDTEIEEQIFWSLYAHITENNSEGLQNMFPKIYALVKSGEYPEMFSPPSGIVYRVLAGIDLKTASKLLDLPVEELKTDKTWYVDTKYTMKPKKFIQSWTTKPNVDTLISLVQDAVYDADGPITMLLEAEVPASGKFIMNPSAACKIDGINSFCNESEVVSGGPVKLIGASFYNKNPYASKIFNNIEVKKLYQIYSIVSKSQSHELTPKQESQIMMLVKKSMQRNKIQHVGVDEIVEDLWHHGGATADLRSIANYVLPEEYRLQDDMKSIGNLIAALNYKAKK